METFSVGQYWVVVGCDVQVGINEKLAKCRSETQF